MNLATPKSVRKLQRALYVKAKANPAYRFYTLYDKICRKDVLEEAWSRCRANGGSSGVDGQSFAGIEFKGVKEWLEQLAQRTAHQNLPTASGAEGQHSQSGWEDKAAWNSDYQREGSTDGSRHCVRGDL